MRRTVRQLADAIKKEWPHLDVKVEQGWASTDRKIPGTRLEFIDRHIFYDGRYINTELLTAVLEDYSQPRPMTEQERSVFLQDAFAASEWGTP